MTKTGRKDLIGLIVTIVGAVSFAWFLLFFIRYGWNINEVNIAMGTNGCILFVGGLILMHK